MIELKTELGGSSKNQSMKLLKPVSLSLICALWIMNASAQPANAYLNLLTLNGGQVPVGGTVDLQVTIGNTGPSAIQSYRVRAQISVPTTIVNLLTPASNQTG